MGRLSLWLTGCVAVLAAACTSGQEQVSERDIERARQALMPFKKQLMDL